MPIKYLTVESVLNLHEAILKDTKEDKGLAPHAKLNELIEEMMVEIATDQIDKKQLTKWLKKYSIEK